MTNAGTELLAHGAAGRAPSRTRPRRAHIADAVMKLVENARRGHDVSRTIAVIARTLELDGDPEGAARLREAGSRSTRRGSADGSAEKELARTTSALLQRLDWLPPAQIVFAATNLAEAIDPALMRRLPTRIAFDLPPLEARIAMIEGWLGRSDVSPECRARLAEETDGLSGAELRAKAMALGRDVIRAGLGAVA